MKVLSLFSLLFSLMAFNAHAFRGHDQFQVDIVKPWGEFGFRALGKGKNITEMRFNCGQVSNMGLVVEVINDYGKRSSIVLPAGELGPEKQNCQRVLKKYFAGLYSKRGVASLKSEQRTVELNVIRGGILSEEHRRKTLSFK